METGYCPGMSQATVLAIAEELRRRRTSSQKQLVQATGYDKVAMSKAFKNLDKAQLIQKCGKKGKETLLQLHPSAGMLVGVDTTGDKIAVAVTNLAYDVQGFDEREPGWSDETRSGEPHLHTLRAIAAAIKRALKSDDYVRLVGVGLALPGPIYPQGVSRSSSLLPRRVTALTSSGQAVNAEADLAELLTHGDHGIELPYRELDDGYGATRTRRIVAVQNDASLAALGAFARMRDVDASAPDDVLYVGVTPMGVGAGVVLGGRLVPGATGLAGELGHLRVKPDGPLCPRCGGRGCVETLASEQAFVEQIKPLFVDKTSLDITKILADDHPGVAQALWEAGWYVGVALAHTCMVLNPARVVLGGKLVEHEAFWQGASWAIERNAIAQVRQVSPKEFMPTWNTLSRGADDRLTPELLGALTFAFDELSADYLRGALTAKWNHGEMHGK